jgi:phage shock protein PspC (stress-responsive transcriptional regulator)
MSDETKNEKSQEPDAEAPETSSDFDDTTSDGTIASPSEAEASTEATAESHEPPAPPPPPLPTATGEGAEVPPVPPQEPAAYSTPHAYAPQRRLLRRQEGKVIAGVCSGLGAYTGVDPVIWRIGFVVLVFGGGAGILAYIVAWLVMPMARPGEPLPEPALGPDSSQVGRWIGIGLLAVGALILFNGFWHFRGGVFWGLLLLGIGVAVWGRDLMGPRPQRPDGRPPVSPPPPSPPPSSNPTGTSPTTPITPPTTPPPPTPPPRYSAAASAPRPQPAAVATAERARREPPSVLGRLVIGASALAIGGALLLDNVDAVNLTPRAMFAVLLAIVGLGLLIGAWWGHARWLIIPGVLLTVALAIASLIPLHIRGGLGEVTWSPETRTNVRGSYELFAGKAILDLSKVDFEADRTVEVDVTFGELLIVVDDDQPLDARVKVQGGQMDLLGEEQDGWDIQERVQRPGDEELGTLKIDSEVVFGEVTVRNVRSSDDFESGRNGDRFNFGPNDDGDSFRFNPPVLESGGVR